MQTFSHKKKLYNEELLYSDKDISLSTSVYTNFAYCLLLVIYIIFACVYFSFIYFSKLLFSPNLYLPYILASYVTLGPKF